MAEQFYSILTSIGKAKIANASVFGTKLNLTTLALGDGNGKYYNPTESQEALINEVWRGNVGAIATDSENLNWIVMETMIAGNVGGFFIREVGVFDDEGSLIAIGKYPETYKPIVSDGATKDLIIRMILEVDNASSVTLKIDSTSVIATKKDIEILDNKIKNIDIPVHSVNGKIGTIELKAEDIKTGSGNTVESQIVDMKYKKAGGTATEITVTAPSLVDGYSKTFIVSENNNGTYTTINGKPLYKPNTTASPNLIAGKAVTVWYSSTNKCFFIKASAEGNADVANVLAGKTFSNDNDTGIIGTMPNRGSLSQTLTTQGGQYNLPSGYYSGGYVKAQFLNLVPENIKLGVNIGGVVGTLIESPTIKIVNSEKNIIYEFITKGNNGAGYNEYDIPKTVIPPNAQYIEAINKIISSDGTTYTTGDVFAKFNINTGEIIRGKNTYFDKVEALSSVIRIRLWNVKSITLMIS